MWPLDHGSILVLYLATLALHAVFVSYVVAGTAYVLVQTLRRRDDAIANTVRDRLPFMLGCGITAGVAPLLFVGLLHQRRFYTANLLLGPRWMAIVPALIVGFYALYIVKNGERWRRLALGVALACFAFVAWSWSELHELMQADPVWHDFYAAGRRVFLVGSIAPRLVVLFGAMATLFATIAAWSTTTRKHLAVIAIAARFVSICGALWLWQIGFSPGAAARAWVAVLIVAVVVDVAGWIVMLRRPSDRVLAVATAAGSGTLLAAVVVREAPRIALIEPTHELASGAGGWLVFAVTTAFGIAAIAWVVRTVRA